jgi:sugar phosphate isomerase/epimerase
MRGEGQMSRLGIDFISVFGLPPVDFVNLAADLGCGYISLGLMPNDRNPHGYPAYSLADPALQRELKAALRDRGVALGNTEGFFVLPGRDVADYAPALDMMAGLGTERINTIGLDPDQGRCFDQLAALAELAGARGVQTTLEFVIGCPIGDLPSAVAAWRHVGRPDFKLLIDPMHLMRSGSGAADVAALEPGTVGYAQLCDCTRVAKDQMHEARYERMVPGEGELPLGALVAALPRDVPIGLEIPQLSLAEAGVGPQERLGRCVAAARELLAKAGVPA